MEKMAFFFAPMYSYFITLFSVVMFGEWLGEKDKIVFNEYLMVTATVFILLILRKIRLSLMGLKLGFDRQASLQNVNANDNFAPSGFALAA